MQEIWKLINLNLNTQSSSISKTTVLCHFLWPSLKPMSLILKQGNLQILTIDWIVLSLWCFSIFSLNLWITLFRLISCNFFLSKIFLFLGFSNCTSLLISLRCISSKSIERSREIPHASTFFIMISELNMLWLPLNILT